MEYRIPRDWVIRVQDGLLPSRSTIGYMSGYGVVTTLLEHAQRYTQEDGLVVATRLKKVRPDLRFIVTSEAAQSETQAE